MTLAYMGYLMIAVFMILIMTKKMSAFTSLLLVPLVFGAIVCAMNGVPILEVGNYAAKGIGSMAKTFSLLLFAITYFGIMISAGLFDPMVDKVVSMVKGDPLKVLVGTSIMAACVSLDGDGTTTTLICCTAMIPIFKRLNMNMLHLAGIVLLQNTVMNLLPWGGPTARVMAALNLGADEILRPLVPGMILAVIYNIGVAYYLGLKERKRLGIVDVNSSEMKVIPTAEEARFKRPRLIWFNLGLTIVTMYVLIAGLLPSHVAFGIASAVALIVNYTNLKDQKKMLDEHGGDAIQVVIMILAAGVLMGVLNESGMSDAMALHMASLVPASLGSHFAAITALISCAGTFFLSNDAFYYGVLPILAETGYTYGFTALNMGVASVMGQAFHLISPLVGFLYLLLQLTEQSLIDVQKFVGKWAIGLFICFVIGASAFGALPL